MSLELNINKLTRQEKLKIWLMTNGISQRWLANQLGITQQALSMILKGLRSPKKRINQLVELGVPRELLPEPKKQ